MKHPVPKKKASRGQSSCRYKHFKNLTLKRIANDLQFENCPKCGEAKLIHQVCHECGSYRGLQIIDKSREIEKITKIKA